MPKPPGPLPRRSPGPPRGLTIIEIVVASAILLLVLMAMVTLYPSALMAVRRAEHRLEAVALAQSIIEKKRSQSFAQLSSLTLDHWNDVDAEDRPAPKEDGVEFVPQFRVFQVAGARPQKMLGLQVKVDWKESFERHCTISQELWICDIRR